MSGLEANFDGLVGPTHNYAGLAFGNVASARNKDQAANPRAAALQGLTKMRALADIIQASLMLNERSVPNERIISAGVEALRGQGVEG